MGYTHYHGGREGNWPMLACTGLVSRCWKVLLLRVVRPFALSYGWGRYVIAYRVIDNRDGRDRD